MDKDKNIVDTAVEIVSMEDVEPSEDKELYTQSSNESAAAWDRLLAPYVPLGLTYTYDDPDHDGNGLTIYSPAGCDMEVYAVDGRLVEVLRLAEGANRVDTLARGVYVINGEKVVF